MCQACRNSKYARLQELRLRNRAIDRTTPTPNNIKTAPSTNKVQTNPLGPRVTRSKLKLKKVQSKDSGLNRAATTTPKKKVDCTFNGNQKTKGQSKDVKKDDGSDSIRFAREPNRFFCEGDDALDI